MTTKARLLAVSIDCPEPKKLAEFYHAILGWDITYAEDEYAAVSDGTSSIYFGRVADRKPVVWPSPDKQFHLDFRVADVERAVAEYVALGATRPEFQPGVTEEGTGWIVLQDPAGHLFCVCPEASS
ncbi:VOC family protein [Nonomuraea jiangxiensis]|uniref:Catechol 2,3-dioxygenase n=1 Tax=Nonomuraea jiangxiensis TaxID=633440 RepID=A0A1G8ZZB3_9ACTN|nr:VOC family protein [Nonomuraea jiangxiensis]SDK19490.1 Catechol 2,3-dioxygenase [Nonomuraea jiangxiensis]